MKTTTKNPQSKSAAFVRKNTKNYSTRDWVAYTYDEAGNRIKPRIFEGSSKMSYSNVRTAYNNETQIRRFDDVRACRVENF